MLLRIEGLEGWNDYLTNKNPKKRVAAAQSMMISGLVLQSNQCVFSLPKMLGIIGSLNFAGSLSFQGIRMLGA